MNIRRLALAVALVAAAPLAYAQSQTKTDNMLVSINVTNNCSVAAGALAFGNADLSANADATATISVTCSNTGAYSLAFNNGGNAAGAQRRMQRGTSGEFLNYNLSGVAPGGTALTGFSGTSTGGNVANTHTVHGRVPTGQSNKTIGAYNDSVLVTLTY